MAGRPTSHLSSRELLPSQHIMVHPRGKKKKRANQPFSISLGKKPKLASSSQRPTHKLELKLYSDLHVVVHACHPSTGEGEAGGWPLTQGQLYS